PRVVIRREGITGRAMKLRVMKGSMPGLTPSSWAFALANSSFSLTDVRD
ncbi:hypothetical protein NOIMNB_NOIMNB_04525, partial [Dysosmobacter welbionis]